MPGVFTMLGIFGTFVGLTQGVTALSMQFSGGNTDVASLSQGVLGLMHGMGTAFWTSILGIMLALTWMYFDRRLTRTADRRVGDLRGILNRLCPSLHDEGFAKYLLEVTVDQKDSIKTLATDIATKVVEGFEQSMQRTMVPALQDFNRAVGEAHTQGMEQLIEQFGGLMGERLRQQFENLATTIEQLCGWQKESRDALDAMITRLSESAAKQDEMITNSMRAAAAFQSSMVEIGRLHESLSVTLEDFRNLSREMNEIRHTVEESHRGIAASVLQMQELAGPDRSRL